MVTKSTNVKSWSDGEGNFCMWFPDEGTFYWGFSYVRDAHDIFLILEDITEEEYAEDLARIMLGVGFTTKYLDLDDETLEAYGEALEDGTLYDFVLDYIVDPEYIKKKDPDIKRASGLLIGDILG